MNDPEPLQLPEIAERRTTSDQLVESLREAILSGVFKDGDELNQVTLAKHYNVSRVPVREALRQLQAEGLVVAKAHYRAVVSSLTQEKVIEIIQLRALIETYLLERAAPHIDSARMAELESLCDQMDDGGEHADWLALNRRFHELLYEPSRATIAVDLSRQLAGRVSRYLRLHHLGVERRREANEEHRRVLGRLEVGDVAGAVEELGNHISHTGDRLAALFPEQGDEAAAR